VTVPGRLAEPGQLAGPGLGCGPVEIRSVEGEELLGTAFALRAYAFEGSPREPDTDRLRRAVGYLAGSRVLVGFDAGRAVATATALPMTQAVRGVVLPMSGIAAVASHPAARRRGIARALVGRLLAQGAEDGQAVSCLYPFRESFYGRLGYVGLPQIRVATVNPHTLAPLLDAELGGQVELLPIAEGYSAYRELLARVQPSQHGMALREEPSAGRQREADLWVALARDDGGTVLAGMTYQIEAWRGELRAGGFVTASVPGMPTRGAPPGSACHPARWWRTGSTTWRRRSAHAPTSSPRWRGCSRCPAWPASAAAPARSRCG
jgi:predicted N-acetyltransferase YhbS